MKQTHKEVFTKYLKEAPRNEVGIMDWGIWLAEEGLRQCEVCRKYTEDVDVIVLRREDGTIRKEAHACADGCDETLRKKWGVDVEGYPMTRQTQK